MAPACEGAHVDQSNTQVDFSASERRDSRFSVYIEAFKLIGSIYSTHGRFDEALLDVVEISTGCTPSASCGSGWLTRSPKV
jgi:hypothetical protein